MDLWNQQHPDAEVHPGDFILDVNGCSTVKRMQKALLKSNITMKICRFPQRFELMLKKAGRNLGFKFERPANTNLPELRIIEVMREGCLAEWNAQQVRASHWHLVVRPDMRIEAANNVENDAGAIEEQLRDCEEVRLRVRRLRHSRFPNRS